MGLTHEELEMVKDLKHYEVYERIYTYYSNFIRKWNSLSEHEKENYIFGNGFTCNIGSVNNSAKYLSGLGTKPSVADSIELAINVFSKDLQYCYHDTDNYGIKMGAYAKDILDNFNNGKWQ